MRRRPSRPTNKAICLLDIKKSTIQFVIVAKDIRQSKLFVDLLEEVNKAYLKQNSQGYNMRHRSDL